MTVTEQFERFDANFAKLRHNREKVPLEKLKTEYAKPYNALLNEIIKYADWFADEYLNALTFPLDGKDEAGNAWFYKKYAAILKEENQPGGLRDQWRAALIDRLNKEEFEELVYRRYERCLKEAFDPYWQRHNRWVGKPENRWIYNDIFQKFWYPPHDDPKLGIQVGGMWINSDYSDGDVRFPPNIGPDPMTQEGATT